MYMYIGTHVFDSYVQCKVSTMNKKERKTFEKENKKQTQYIISSLWAYGCISMSNKQKHKRFQRKCLDQVRLLF